MKTVATTSSTGIQEDRFKVVVITTVVLTAIICGIVVLCSERWQTRPQTKCFTSSYDIKICITK